jgi:hypothetical protein
MLRAKKMFLHSKVSTALVNAKAITLEGGLDPVTLRTGAKDCNRTSLQPVYIFKLLVLSKPKESIHGWRDKFQLLFP